MSPVRPTYEHEQAFWAQGFERIAGVDEVGMGCLAGPVIAAAVILSPDMENDLIRDSKTLSLKQRIRLAGEIRTHAVAWAVGSASPEEIAIYNIRGADALAMRRALDALAIVPDAVLTDAFLVPDLSIRQKAVIRGDQLVRSIAAASIIAKVTRDALMEAYEQTYPGYGFARHKGYGTKVHQEALERLGPCPIHRRTFAPILRLST